MAAPRTSSGSLSPLLIVSSISASVGAVIGIRNVPALMPSRTTRDNCAAPSSTGVASAPANRDSRHDRVSVDVAAADVEHDRRCRQRRARQRQAIAAHAWLARPRLDGDRQRRRRQRRVRQGEAGPRRRRQRQPAAAAVVPGDAQVAIRAGCERQRVLAQPFVRQIEHRAFRNEHRPARPVAACLNPHPLQVRRRQAPQLYGIDLALSAEIDFEAARFLRRRNREQRAGRQTAAWLGG